MVAQLAVSIRGVQAEADTGTIGGSLSHEFQLLSEVGEDSVLHCACGKYAANVERAVSIAAPMSPDSIKHCTCDWSVVSWLFWGC